MLKDKTYKKILVVAAGRINLADTANNGLLLRNLFRSYPKDKIAQVFNSGDNGDRGFFSSYYRLGEADRRFGKFYKKIYKEGNSQLIVPQNRKATSWAAPIAFFRRTFIDTGIYELVFRPKLSTQFLQWLDNFHPDLILVQGYSLTFTDLSLAIKSYTNAKLVFLTTDDWPQYLYNGSLGENKILSILPRLNVRRIVKKLMREVDIPIAFGYAMQVEYTKRYGKKFYSVIHSDNHLRFDKAERLRLKGTDTFSIVTIGTFNKYRWPLLKDFDLACEKLKMLGIDAKVSVISDAVEPAGLESIKNMKNITIHPDPGSDNLPALLKGADLLLLIEGFDEYFASIIRLSISTKAHLYMFSRVPILLYSHPITGITSYAQKFGWAYVITERDIDLITNVLKSLYTDKDLRSRFIEKAYDTAMENHDVDKTEEKLYQILHCESAMPE